MIFKILLTFFLYWIYLVRVRCEMVPVDFENNDYYYYFHLSEDVDIEEFSRAVGFKYHMKVDHLDNHHIFFIEKGVLEDEIKEKIENYFSLEKGRNAIDGFNSDKLFYYEKQKLVKPVNRGAIRDDIYFDNQDLYNDEEIVNNVVKDPTVDQAKKSTEDLKERLKEIKKELGISDPCFDKQWYLFNTEKPGVDINVTGVWLQGITGKGVTVAIADNGLDYTNKDLAPNYNSQGSYDFVSKTDDPNPKSSSDTHGTRCAGEVAAARNDFCGLGVAYESNISGLRFLPSGLSYHLESLALSYKPNVNYIYSCSWGPPGDGYAAIPMYPTTYSAIIKGIKEGRNGLGSIYVFGTGNGGSLDGCNYDGYANSPYTITIAAIDSEDKNFYFSESCPCILASTYSGGENGSIYTTDLGKEGCTTEHTGASASTPLAAGIIALVLSANPNLTWHDVQALIVETAVPFNLEYPGWDKLPSERHYSNNFGFGKLDAYRMVERAKTFKTLNAQTMFSTQLIPLNKTFSENGGHITSTFYIDSGSPTHYNFKNLEYVGVSFHYKHQYKGHLEFNITSPSGVTSVLAHRRINDYNSGTFHWFFTTVKHWGETIVGNWTIDVEDEKVSNLDGEIFDWQLHFFGESIDSSKAELHPPYPFKPQPPSKPAPPSKPDPNPPSDPSSQQDSDTSLSSTPTSTSSSKLSPPPTPQPKPEPQPEQKPTSIASSTTSTNLIPPAPTSSSSKTKTSTTRKASSTTKTSTRPSPTEGTFTGSGCSHLSFFEKRHLLLQMILLLFFFLFLGYSF
uniref:Protease 1 n=2 Tax=Pneumocystis carinii TaxID=4754 RepID=O13304_PNECA|nr:protease 1 [Pneumocystis carinii]